MESENFMRDLRAYRPQGMEHLPASLVWPRYDGLCVGNIPASIGQMLGCQLSGVLPPLRSDVLEGLTDGVQRVVVLVIDALGWGQLQEVMALDDTLVFHTLAEKGRLVPITSVFPSTTDNVLSTIWTGCPPVQHGLLAYEMFLREWGMAVESIRFSPFFRPFSGDLVNWGLDPETFLPVPAVSQQLIAQGARAYTVILKDYTETPLSQMHFRGLEDSVVGHATMSDFWVLLRRVLENRREVPMVLNGYWSMVDTLAHRYGPLDETGVAEVRALGILLEEIFLKKLRPVDRAGTLLLLTADHGQVTTPPRASVLLEDHPVLRDALFLAPLGESRAPFFYVRAGHEQLVWEYLQEHLAQHFVFLKQDEVIRSGLLGPGEPYAEVRHRLGDIVGISLDEAYIARDAERAHRMLGRHGGLRPEELIVPLLAVRLDALD